MCPRALFVTFLSVYTGQTAQLCPASRVCLSGVLVPCKAWEYEDRNQACIVCPVGSYCENGEMHRCPVHSTTRHDAQTHVNSCFCVHTFKPVASPGTHAGFVCTGISSQKNQTTIKIRDFTKVARLKNYNKWSLWTNYNTDSNLLGGVLEIDFRFTIYTLHLFSVGDAYSNISGSLPVYLSQSMNNFEIASFQTVDYQTFYSMIISSNQLDSYILEIHADAHWKIDNMKNTFEYTPTFYTNSKNHIPLAAVILTDAIRVTCYLLNGVIYMENTIQESNITNSPVIDSSDIIVDMNNTNVFFIHTATCMLYRYNGTKNPTHTNSEMVTYKKHQENTLYFGLQAEFTHGRPVLAISENLDVGFLYVKWDTCSENSASNTNSHFDCVCMNGYKLKNQICQACDPSEHIVCNHDTNTEKNCTRQIHKDIECVCKQGTYYDKRLQICVECPYNYFCDGQRIEMCPLHSYTKHKRAQSITDCHCEDGRFRSSRACQMCPYGSVCSHDQIQHCPLYSTTLQVGAVNLSMCVCVGGYYQTNKCELVGYGYYSDPTLPTGRQKCPDFHTTYSQDAKNADECVCQSSYINVMGVCTKCQSNQVCPINSTETDATTCPVLQEPDQTQSECVCIPGYYNSAPAQEDRVCTVCTVGYYCHESVGYIHEKCPPFMTSAKGTVDISLCTCSRSDLVKIMTSATQFVCACPDTSYNDKNNCLLCPNNSRVMLTNKENKGDASDCVCSVGYMAVSGYVQGDYTKNCVPCPRGYYCPFTANEEAVPCPHNTFGPLLSQWSKTSCIQCPNTTSDTASRVSIPNRHESILNCLQEFIPFELNNTHQDIQVSLVD